MDEKDLQKKYQELQTLDQHMKKLNDELTTLENKTTEIESIKQSLEELKKTTKDDEILVPVSNGIFLKAKIQDKEKLLVNVGSDTIVQKTIEETKELVSEQQKELEKYKSEIITQMTAVDEQAYLLEKELQKEFEK